MTWPLRWIAVGAALALLSGCGITNGDFGRPRPSLIRDNVYAWRGPAVAPRSLDRPWRDQLTDEERRLRDLAYPLIAPPYDRQQWYSVLGEYGLGSRPSPYPDRAAYASLLFSTPYRSQTARYNRLMEDIRNDVVRLEPFFSTARYVRDMDSKRAAALDYVSQVTEQERANALQRIAENRNIVLWVQGSLCERVESYRVALEQMVIAAPSPVAVEAERALTLLKQRVDAYSA